MSGYIPVELRRLVQSRSGGICEYCLIHESDTYLGCQVDHIISEKHGGPTTEENLAYACVFCNRNKGSDVGSVTESNEFLGFYNPRKDIWPEHFQVNGPVIESKTPAGEITSRILSFNSIERLLEREELIRYDKYPSEPAQRLINQRS